MEFPNPIGGSAKLVGWLNGLRAAAVSSRITSVVGGRLLPSGDSKQLVIDPPPPPNQYKLHPFKIYQFPRFLRQYQNTDDWQRFMVRSGMVYDQVVLGTDKFEYPGKSTDEEVYTTNLIPPNNGNAWDYSWNEVVVPADGDTYHFWISLVAAPAGTPEVLFGLEVADAIYLKDGTDASGDEVWTDFGSPDPYHIPIGTVAWLEGMNRWEIHQNLRDHVNGRDPCILGVSGFVGLDASSVGQLPMRFVGVYGAGVEYWIGDVVLQDSADFRAQYILCPPRTSTSTREAGPISGVSPATNNPDPWLLLSKSPLPAQGVYATGAYDGTKDYLRRA